MPGADHDPAADLRALKIRNEKAKATKREFENQRLAGAWISVKEFRRVLETQVDVMADVLHEIEVEFPQALHHVNRARDRIIATEATVNSNGREKLRQPITDALIAASNRITIPRSRQIEAVPIEWITRESK